MPELDETAVPARAGSTRCRAYFFGASTPPRPGSVDKQHSMAALVRVVDSGI
jgi:hypothetical protein